MATGRWLGIGFVIASAFAACTSIEQAGSTGTGAASSSSSGATSSSTGGGPSDAAAIACPSMYTTVPQSDCDLLQQDCPDGETCAPVGSGTQCVPALGFRTAGEVCQDATECAAKLFCVAGVCAPVCCPDTGVPCIGGACNVPVSFAGSTGTAQVCGYSPKCQLFSQDACPPGLDCHVHVAEGNGICSPPSSTPAPELGPCQFLNDCGTMQHCFQVGSGPATCHYYCLLEGGSSKPPGFGGCPSGEDCVSDVAGAPIDFGLPGTGLCFSPENPSDGGPGDAGPD